MDVYSSKDKKPCCTNTIAEIIESISRNQRSVCNTCGDCVGCDGYLCNNFYNTIPVRLTYCCGGEAVGGLIGAGGITTNYFRIECVTYERFVKLRLLSVTNVDGEIVVAGTNYTMVVEIDCIGSIQCFEPVNITGCTPVAA